MDIQNTAILWRYTKIVFAISLITWISETAFFLIKEGWHWEATSVYEKNFDKAVFIMTTIGLVMGSVVLIGVLDFLLSEEN